MIMKSPSSVEVACPGGIPQVERTLGVIGQSFEISISNASSSSLTKSHVKSTEALYSEFDGILKSLGIEPQSSETPEPSNLVVETDKERQKTMGKPDLDLHLMHKRVVLQQSPGSINAIRRVHAAVSQSQSQSQNINGNGIPSTASALEHGRTTFPETLKKELLHLGNEYSSCLQTTCIKCTNIKGAFKLEFRSTLPDTSQPVCLAIGVTEDYPVECPDLFNLSQLPFPTDIKSLDLDQLIGHFVRIGIRKHLPFNLMVTDMVTYWFKVLQIVSKIYIKRQKVNAISQIFS